jgi:hypothetical protein
MSPPLHKPLSQADHLKISLQSHALPSHRMITPPPTAATAAITPPPPPPPSQYYLPSWKYSSRTVWWTPPLVLLHCCYASAVQSSTNTPPSSSASLSPGEKNGSSVSNISICMSPAYFRPSYSSTQYHARY